MPFSRARSTEPMRIATYASLGMPKAKLESPIEVDVDMNNDMMMKRAVIVKLSPSSSHDSSDAGSDCPLSGSAVAVRWSSRGHASHRAASMDSS